jgi:hypothetical protein
VTIQSLWHTRAEWIRDPSGYVFLPRAMLEIGAALFPTEWTRHEPEEWEVARYDSKKRGDRAAASSRFDGVCSEVTAACQLGDLLYGLRPWGGGAVLPGLPQWWNADDAVLRCRFNMFSLNTSRPFQSGISERQNEDWICISRASLDNFLSKRTNSNAAALAKALNVPHLSPYLALMIHVARKLNISPKNQPLKADIEKELRAAWPKGIGRPSKNLVEAAATLIREPGSQLGLAKKISVQTSRGLNPSTAWNSKLSAMG